MAFLFQSSGLFLLMLAGHIEYKTRGKLNLRAKSSEKKLRAIANISLLLWLAFGFSSAYWMPWYLALLALTLSVILPGNFTKQIIARDMVNKSTYYGFGVGLFFCTAAFLLGTS